jgi:hypothetical protein
MEKADLRQEHHSETTDVLRVIVEQSTPYADRSPVARALLSLLVRSCITRHSIDAIITNVRDCGNDAAALLRCIWDAYLQAAYIAHDPSEAESRASAYLTYEHVELRELVRRVLGHDTTLCRRIKEGEHYAENLAAVEANFERAKGPFLSKQGKIRDKWYPLNLRGIADAVGVVAEYDTSLWQLHSSTHSSALATASGPMISLNFMPHWADFITARTARLNVLQNKLPLPKDTIAFLDSLALHSFGALTQ